MTKSKAEDPLFSALLAQARLRNPEVWAGAMFRSLAVFVGRKMAACVLDGKIGLRVPAALASAGLLCGRARPFRPYGKAPMREWIEIDGAALIEQGDLLTEAIAFAGRNNLAK
jgi:hypothetical protein